MPISLPTGPGHEVDFILDQDGKLVALEIKTGSTVTSSDAVGIRAFRASQKKNQRLVRGVVLHAARVARCTPTFWRCRGAGGWQSNETSSGPPEIRPKSAR